MSAVRFEVCSYSGLKIAPGHGTHTVRTDGKHLDFLDRRCRVFFENKWNPRKIDWTVPARRAHNKECMEKTQKVRRRNVERVDRGILGRSAAEIAERRAKAAQAK